MADTPVLALGQYTALQPMDFNQVNGDNQTLDTVPPASFTSATRPTTDLYQGRLIYETDTQLIMMYDLATTTWRPARGPLSVPWTAWVPVWTGVATPSTVARYRVIDGKTVTYRIDAKIVTAPTAGVTVTLPVPAKAVATTAISSIFGKIHVKDVSAGIYFEGIAIEDTSNAPVAGMRLMVPNTGASTQLAQITGAIPFAWAVNDTICIIGEYEAD